MALGIGPGIKAPSGLQRGANVRSPGLSPRMPANHLKMGLAKAVVAPKPLPGNTASTVPATQTTPVDPLAAAKSVSTPAVGAGQFKIPAYQGAVDPRDSTYYENLNKLTFSDNQKYGELQQQQTQADTAYNQALQTAIKGRAIQERELGENAIKGNLGASGWLDRTEGLQRSAYSEGRANAALTKEQEDQARGAARSALEQGFSIEAAGELAQAAARYGAGAGKGAESEEPELGGTVATAQAGKGGGGKGKQPNYANLVKNPWGRVASGGGVAKGSGGTSAPKSAAPANAYKAALSKQKALNKKGK